MATMNTLEPGTRFVCPGCKESVQGQYIKRDKEIAFLYQCPGCETSSKARDWKPETNNVDPEVRQFKFNVSVDYGTKDDTACIVVFKARQGEGAEVLDLIYMENKVALVPPEEAIRKFVERWNATQVDVTAKLDIEDGEGEENV